MLFTNANMQILMVDVNRRWSFQPARATTKDWIRPRKERERPVIQTPRSINVGSSIDFRGMMIELRQRFPICPLRQMLSIFRLGSTNSEEQMF